jgi:hypothetical protein
MRDDGIDGFTGNPEFDPLGVSKFEVYGHDDFRPTVFCGATMQKRFEV